MFFRPYPENGSREEKEAWADNECETMLYMLELESWGCLYSYAGLIGKVPLCNDGPDY